MVGWAVPSSRLRKLAPKFVYAKIDNWITLMKQNTVHADAVISGRPPRFRILNLDLSIFHHFSTFSCMRTAMSLQRTESSKAHHGHSACLPQVGAQQADAFLPLRSREGAGLRSLPAVAGRGISPRFFRSPS
jgi:hypothetical protein